MIIVLGVFWVLLVIFIFGPKEKIANWIYRKRFAKLIGCRENYDRASANRIRYEKDHLYADSATDPTYRELLLLEIGSLICTTMQTEKDSVCKEVLCQIQEEQTKILVKKLPTHF